MRVKGSVDAVSISIRMKESEETEEEDKEDKEHKVPDQSVEMEAYTIGN